MISGLGAKRCVPNLLMCLLILRRERTVLARDLKCATDTLKVPPSSLIG